MKNKVGDKVRIIENLLNHKFRIGEIVTIIHVDDDDVYEAKNNKGDLWYICDNEIVDADSEG